MAMQHRLSKLNFNLVKFSLTFISLFFFQNANKSIADSTFTFHRELLIGEWSKPGECSKTRFIYTADGRYVWLEKNGSNWRTLYNGIYVTSPTRLNSLVIAEGQNMGGEIIEIQELTRTTYKGEWKLQLSEDANAENQQDVAFSYVRCQGTALTRQERNPVSLSLSHLKSAILCQTQDVSHINLPPQCLLPLCPNYPN